MTRSPSVPLRPARSLPRRPLAGASRAGAAIAGTTASLALLVTNPLPARAQAAGAPAGGGPNAGAAQPAARTGRVVGRVVDAASGAGVSDVQVRVEGASVGALSGVDGRFVVAGVPAGPASLVFRRIGFQAKTVTGVVVPAGRAVEQNVALAASTVQLQQVTVTASAERGSVGRALDEQRTSASIVNATTAEQIARSPDADAAQAVRRVSGVTVQDNRYVIVRGLGERYTQTSLNGARVPSPEPERKVVPLDLFPSALIDNITTAKTFTPDQLGDFSGALVDIRTREFPARRTVALSASSGANSLATGRDVVSAPAAGGEWLALNDGARQLPGVVAAAGPRLSGANPGAGSNALLRAFRNAWTPRTRGGAPNGAFGASVGGSDPVFGHPLGYVASLSYSTTQEVRADERLVIPQADGRGGAAPLSAYAGSTGRQSVLWGGLLNLSTMVGARSRLTFNNTYNRTADNEARTLAGVDEQFQTTLDLRRLGYVTRSVLSNQVRADFSPSPRVALDGNLSRSQVTRDEPDRSDLVYQGTGAQAFWRGQANDATRFFGALDERDLAGGGNLRVALGDPSRNRAVKLGGYGRQVDRASDLRAYDVLNLSLDEAARRLPAEAIIGPSAAGDNPALLVRPSAFGGRYTAREYLQAGYAMAELPLGGRLRVVGGARVERADIKVVTQTAQLRDTSTRIENVDVLPSLSLTYRLSGLQNLRLSATQTVSRPEYRELSPVAYVEIAGQNEERGNPALGRALIQNYDARWEWYPGAGEVLSLGAFAKHFDRPIERVFVATTGRPQIGFVNARSATNYGVELEARGGLGFLGALGESFNGSANVTVMRSRIRITDSLTAATNPDRPMVGQSPYVVNLGLGYAPASRRVTATLLYNVVGRRIVLAGVEPLPDTYEMPRNVLDFSVQVPLSPVVEARLNGSNLLDAPYRERIGALDRRYYRMGRVVSLGVSWKPSNRADLRPAVRP